MAVAASVMSVDGENNFQPSKVVTGAEALAAVSRVEALASNDRK